MRRWCAAVKRMRRECRGNPYQNYFISTLTSDGILPLFYLKQRILYSLNLVFWPEEIFDPALLDWQAQWRLSKYRLLTFGVDRPVERAEEAASPRRRTSRPRPQQLSRASANGLISTSVWGDVQVQYFIAQLSLWMTTSPVWLTRRLSAGSFGSRFVRTPRFWQLSIIAPFPDANPLVIPHTYSGYNTLLRVFWQH